MVDRLNSALSPLLSGSASRDRDMGRADFGRLLRADPEDGRSLSRNEGDSVLADHGNAVNSNSMNTYNTKSFDPNTDSSNLSALDMTPDRVLIPPGVDVLLGPDPATGLSILLLHSPYDANSQDGLLVEFENAVPIIDGDRVALIVGLHAQAPGQKDELVVVPWQLLAGNHLSQMIAGVRPMTVSVGAYRNQAQLSVGQTAAVNISTASAPSAALTYGQLPASSAAGQLHAPIDLSADGVDDGIGSSTKLGQQGAFVPWPLRLLRWLTDGNGEVTAWLRDYSLGDDNADSVVRLLHTMSNEQGVRLNRIVLNGRELWRAAEQKQFT